MKICNVILIILLGTTFSFAQFYPPAPKTGEKAYAFQQENRSTGTAAGDHSFKAKYVFLSLILPGAGQWTLNHHNRGKFFLGTDLLLWAGYFGSLSYASVLENDFQSFAAVHAGVNTSGKNDQYWIDISYSSNIYAYNEKKLVERDKNAIYSENSVNYWQWDSESNRLKYNDIRLKQLDWKRTANFVISGLVLNRLVSAIDVIRILKKESRQNKERASLLYFNYHPSPLQGDVFSVNLTMAW